MSLLLVGLLAASARISAMPAAQPVVANPAASNDESQAEDEPELPQTPEQKIAAAAYREYNRSLLRSLRASGDARDRALATQMWFLEDAPDVHVPTPVERAARGTILRKAAEAAPDDVLVQWFWLQASPEDSGCNAKDPCPHRIESSARLQPDNGSAWVPVFDAAWTANDVPAAESALAQMAHATRFDEQFGTALKAWMDVYRRYPIPRSALVPGSPEARLDEQAIDFSNALAYAVAIAFPAYQAPVNACSRDKHPDASPQRFRDCAQAGRVMLMQSTSLIDRLMARALLRVSGQATADDIANARIADWQYERWIELVSQQSENDLQVVKEMASDWVATYDEIKVMQRQLQRKNIPLTPPANWQPRGRDGKPISPLGESPAPAKP